MERGDVFLLPAFLPPIDAFPKLALQNTARDLRAEDHRARLAVSSMCLSSAALFGAELYGRHLHLDLASPLGRCVVNFDAEFAAVSWSQRCVIPPPDVRASSGLLGMTARAAAKE
jgi:hypothetical protein